MGGAGAAVMVGSRVGLSGEGFANGDAAAGWAGRVRGAEINVMGA
jgi:hypothetical protein